MHTAVATAIVGPGIIGDPVVKILLLFRTHRSRHQYRTLVEQISERARRARALFSGQVKIPHLPRTTRVAPKCPGRAQIDRIQFLTVDGNGQRSGYFEWPQRKGANPFANYQDPLSSLQAGVDVPAATVVFQLLQRHPIRTVVAQIPCGQRHVLGNRGLALFQQPEDDLFPEPG